MLSNQRLMFGILALFLYLSGSSDKLGGDFAEMFEGGFEVFNNLLCENVWIESRIFEALASESLFIYASCYVSCSDLSLIKALRQERLSRHSCRQFVHNISEKRTHFKFNVMAARSLYTKI